MTNYEFAHYLENLIFKFCEENGLGIEDIVEIKKEFEDDLNAFLYVMNNNQIDK